MIQRKNNAVLWMAAFGFALLLGAWTVLFVVASHHRVPEVPVVTQVQPSKPTKSHGVR